MKECAGFDTEYWDVKPKVFCLISIRSLLFFELQIGRFKNRKTGLCLTSPDIFDPSKDEFNPPIIQKCRNSDERQVRC